MSIFDNYKKVTDLFYKKTNILIQEGSVFDSLFLAMSEAYTSLQDTIESNKTPHIYTDLKGNALDSLGMLLGILRETNESDESYLRRVMNHRATHASNNIVAINNALLNLDNSAYVKYTPMTHGAGTATVSIIPNDYNKDTIDAAIKEVSEKLNIIVSKSTYLYYEVPNPVSVTLGIQYSTNIEEFDETLLDRIKESLLNYINNIPPMSYLEIGELEKIGLNSPNISYFKVYTLYLDEESNSNIKILQKSDMKFLLNNVNFERR